VKSSDVDPHSLHADPVPKNLMNADPGQKNHQIDFKQSFKSKEFLFFFKFVPKPFRLATF